MVYVRAGIVEGAGHYLAKAVTIATRYNAVRRQFGGKDGVETQVGEQVLMLTGLLYRLACLVSASRVVVLCTS